METTENYSQVSFLLQKCAYHKHTESKWQIHKRGTSCCNVPVNSKPIKAQGCKSETKFKWGL